MPGSQNINSVQIELRREKKFVWTREETTNTCKRGSYAISKKKKKKNLGRCKKATRLFLHFPFLLSVLVIHILFRKK